MLAFGVVEKGDVLAHISVWIEKEALQEFLDRIMVERDNLIHELIELEKPFKEVGDKFPKHRSPSSLDKKAKEIEDLEYYVK